jgi:hypothetical protein
MGLTATAHDRFWPTSFAERGATVPFTTPVLAAARMRARDGRNVEFLVPGLSGSKGTYVLPSRSVPEMFRLTVHDRALLEALAASGAVTPASIRAASLRVAGTGLAGAEAATAAKAMLAAAQNQALVTQLLMIVRALGQLAPGQRGVEIGDLMEEAGKARAQAAAGAGLGLALQPLLDRLEAWGTAIAPLGVTGTVAIGPQRRIWQQLIDLSLALRDWAAGDRLDEAKPDATLVADIAEETYDIASTPLTELDAEAGRIAAAAVAWPDTRARLQSAMDRVDWLLDGWDHVLKIWDAAQGETAQRQREALSEMVRLLPLIPQSELKDAQRVAGPS